MPSEKIKTFWAGTRAHHRVPVDAELQEPAFSDPMMNFGGMPQDLVLRSMRLFATEVMPAMR